MASHIKNMTQGKPVSLIFSFALPLMIGNVFQQLYTVVDTMVVGKALGVGALAALGAADWLNWMMLGIIQGFTQGFGILMAQEFGAGRHDNLRKSIPVFHRTAGAWTTGGTPGPASPADAFRDPSRYPAVPAYHVSWDSGSDGI